MDWNPLKWFIPSAVDAEEEGEIKSTTDSADLGIKDQSGHKSSTVENKSPASENSSKNGDSSETILEFQLKQSLLDQARVSKKIPWQILVSRRIKIFIE